MQPLFICFTQNLNYAIGWMVIHSLWQATAIAIISGIIALVVRQKSPQLRYWIHNAALLGVLIAAMVTFCMYYDFSKEVGQTIFVPENMEAATNAPVFVANNQSSIDNTQSEPLSMEGLQMYFNRNIYLIVTVWIMGVALFILKLLGGISYVYYLRSRLNFPADEYWLDMVETLGEKAGVKRSMELVESALVRSPLIVGHLKPMILFPIGAINKLNTKEVEAILAHEIAHILRNDYIFNIIQSVIEALFYFHPAVWWISANIRTERENSCDDMALKFAGNKLLLAKTLVQLQEYATTPALVMAFGKKSNSLKERVQRIIGLHTNRNFTKESMWIVLGITITFFAFAQNTGTLGSSKLKKVVKISQPNTNTVKKAIDTTDVKSIGQTTEISREVNNASFRIKDNVKGPLSKQFVWGECRVAGGGGFGFWVEWFYS